VLGRLQLGPWPVVVKGCNVPTTNLDTPISNFLSIKEKHADQPSKKRAKPYCIQMLYLLNHRGWKKTHFRKYMSMQGCCVQCYWSRYVFKVPTLWSWQRRLSRLTLHNMYTQYMDNRLLYTYINVCIRTYPYSHW